MVPGFGEELQTAEGEFHVEPAAEAASDTALGDVTQDLICRNQSIEKDAEEGIDKKDRNSGGPRKLDRSAIVPDTAHDIGVEVVHRYEPQLWIGRDRPKMRIAVRHVGLVSDCARFPTFGFVPRPSDKYDVRSNDDFPL